MATFQEGCPLLQVRDTTAFVMSLASRVRICDTAVRQEAEKIAKAGAGPVIWDHECVHYNDGGAATVQGLLLLDALNFCFWPDADWEYDRLATALKSVLLSNKEAMSGENLAAMTRMTLTKWLGGELPMMDERVRLVREVGRGLVKNFEGKAENMVKAAEKSASKLVQLMLESFPGFRDTAIYQGRQVFLYKRVQIFVGDVWGAFHGQGLGEFHDIDLLTTFPDYRVPQLLRVMGIIEYSAELAEKIDHLIEIDPCSKEEIEIRAATVQAVEMIRMALADLGVKRTSIQIDWDLWQQGETQRKSLLPHHRTLTIFY